MIACKNCQNTQTVKNGFVRDKQRYKCKLCGYNFVLGDGRHPHTTEIKKPCVLSCTRLEKPLLVF
jgi:transposase